MAGPDAGEDARSRSAGGANESITDGAARGGARGDRCGCGQGACAGGCPTREDRPWRRAGSRRDAIKWGRKTRFAGMSGPTSPGPVWDLRCPRRRLGRALAEFVKRYGEAPPRWRADRRRATATACRPPTTLGRFPLPRSWTIGRVYTRRVQDRELQAVRGIPGSSCISGPPRPSPAGARDADHSMPRAERALVPVLRSPLRNRDPRRLAEGCSRRPSVRVRRTDPGRVEMRRCRCLAWRGGRKATAADARRADRAAPRRRARRQGWRRRRVQTRRQRRPSCTPCPGASSTSPGRSAPPAGGARPARSSGGPAARAPVGCARRPREHARASARTSRLE